MNVKHVHGGNDMLEKPKISVYTPTYNRAGILKDRAIPSVLAQTFEDFEYIIVSDGSTDNTKEIVESFKDERIRFYEVERAEPHHNHDSEKVWKIEGSNAANFALDKIRGEWIARIDDDDIWTKDHLEKSYAYVMSHDVDFITSKAKDIESPLLQDYLRLYSKFKLKQNPPVGPHSSWFYRNELSIYKYNPNCHKKKWNSVADTDLLECFVGSGIKIGYLDEVLTIITPRPGETEIGLKAVLEKSKKGIAANSQSTTKEVSNRDKLIELWNTPPYSQKELIWEPYLYMNRLVLTRLLCIEELYKLQIQNHGVIMQFGVYHGRDLALLINLRGIYEPFNYTKKIIGFDTFGGLPEFHKNDGKIGAKGDFSVPTQYEEYLEEVLQYHENECPLSHIRKFELIKGDVRESLPRYLEYHPETIISLLYLDMDIYEPTKFVLETIEPYLVKGSIIVFDELNFKAYPGETIAFRESGFSKYRLHTFPIDPTISWLRYGI